MAVGNTTAEDESLRNQPLLTSVTRIWDLADGDFDTAGLPESEWETGDYVIGECVSPPGPKAAVELVGGRQVDVFDGDRIVGALGARHSLLEAVGDWTLVGPDQRMDLLASGGVIGRLSSRAVRRRPQVALSYRGHVFRDGWKVRMRDFITRYADGAPATPPFVLIAGSSWAGGRAEVAQTVVRSLGRAGERVVALRLTGVGRHRDVLALRDAGAVASFDMVDVGLPSTVCPAGEYRVALEGLLQKLGEWNPTVVVADVGPSPHEPYNTGLAIDRLGGALRATVLCANDAYAVVGLVQSFGLAPTLVTGPATYTSAGISLVEKLTEIQAFNVLDRRTAGELLTVLRSALGAEGCEGGDQAVDGGAVGLDGGRDP
ncbi:MAG: hypothetical protein AAF604_10110 [Acidobacteriota bacterium]